MLRRIRFGIVWVVFWAALCPGCYSWSQAELDADLRKRAAFDLECSETSLQLVPLGEYKSGLTSSQGVRGCGKRATYVLSGAGVWLMNTDSEGRSRKVEESSEAPGRVTP